MNECEGRTNIKHDKIIHDEGDVCPLCEILRALKPFREDIAGVANQGQVLSLALSKMGREYDVE